MAIISHAFWERRFGTRADIVGLTVHVNGAPATIIGVMPEGFALVYEQDLWMPLAPTPALEGRAIGRLRDGATRKRRARSSTRSRARLQAADPATVAACPSVKTYTQAHVAPDAPMIYGSLWAGSWLVLLVACANLANLTMVRTDRAVARAVHEDRAGRGSGADGAPDADRDPDAHGRRRRLAWWLTTWSVRTWAEATRSIYLALDYRVTLGTFAYLVAIALAAGSLFRWCRSSECCDSASAAR